MDPAVLNWAFIRQLSSNALATLLASRLGTAYVVAGLVLLSFLVLKIALNVVGFFWANFLRPGRNLRAYGSWAIVTGATDGIGKAYAAVLAKRGLSLVLVSRTESKLQATAAELESKYGVKTRTVAVDLTQPGDEAMAHIATAIEGLEIGILINNAGMSYDHPDYLEAIDGGDLTSLIAINMLAPTRLCKLVLPGMKSRRRGAIINIGSGLASVAPTSPLLAAYAASKAYVEAFSQSLAQECEEFGVSVQNQAPLFVATKLSKIRRARLDAPFPDTWARAAADQIGYEPSYSPYWFHGLQVALVRSVPSWVVNRHVATLHKRLRAAYYRKKLREETAAAAAAVRGEGGSGSESPSKYDLRRRKAA